MRYPDYLAVSGVASNEHNSKLTIVSFSLPSDPTFISLNSINLISGLDFGIRTIYSCGLLFYFIFFFLTFLLIQIVMQFVE